MNAVRYMTEWDAMTDLATRLGAPSTTSSRRRTGHRKQLRSMGRVAQLAVRASELALADAGLLGDPAIGDGRMGVAYGSSRRQHAGHPRISWKCCRPDDPAGSTPTPMSA